ncbi:MAG: DNA repair protein RecN [Clostridiales bacterium]|nr:DNA repair protein RecN [Clostridiales bacterium]
MLKTLKVKNVALMDDGLVEFSTGLNIISGETGAGKSVLLDALSLALGAKADKTLIKSGEDFLKVEATFVFDKSLTKLENFFNEFDLEYDNTIIISRKIGIDSKSETKFNGQIVPISYLKKFASIIVDIHSQNENMLLLDKNMQLDLIDNSIEVLNKENIEKFYREYREIEEKIEELNKDEDVKQRELDLLNYQINEIESAKIYKGEEEELEEEFKLLKNSEKISNSLNVLKDIFEDNSFNLLSGIKKVQFELSNLNSYINCEDLINRVDSLNIEINDVYDEINNKFDIEFNELRYNEIDERLDTYKKLHRKYGINFEEINQFLLDSKAKRDYLLNYEQTLIDLNKAKSQILDKAFIECKNLDKQRRDIAKRLENSILLELKELAMPNAQIKFEISDFTKENFEKNFTTSGANAVNLLFSANLGEEVKPLDKIASGGEISRLMLAIKTIISNFDDTPTMIFDELDTGISGEASVSTSKKLAKISKTHQIIAISHLFQICSMADRNILVKKIEQNGKTNSIVKILKPEETVVELCRFLMVDNLTEATIKHAEEVKAYCENYKKTI